MRQLAANRIRVGSLLSGLALGVFSATACLGEPAASKQVKLVWTDPGIRSGQRPACLDQTAESMFRPFGDAVAPIFGEINPQRATILIPMPKSEDRPKTDAEWTAFATRLAQGIRAKVQQGLQANLSAFEIRTVQDPGSLTNLAAARPGTPTEQQAQCVRFTEAFLTALDQVKQDLAATEQVHLYGLVGSGSGYAATESISALRRSPLDYLIVVDGIATVDRAVQTSAVMNGHLTLINTAGEALSSPSLVANLQGSQEAQRQDPRIRLLYLDPATPNSPVPPPKTHIDALAPKDLTVAVKEFTRQDAQVSEPAAKDLPRAIMADVFRQVFAAAAGTVLVVAPFGVSMEMKVAPGSIKEAKPGELDKLRKEALEKRPPQGSATWPVPEKGEGK